MVTVILPSDPKVRSQKIKKGQNLKYKILDKNICFWFSFVPGFQWCIWFWHTTSIKAQKCDIIVWRHTIPVITPSGGQNDIYLKFCMLVEDNKLFNIYFVFWKFWKIGFYRHFTPPPPEKMKLVGSKFQILKHRDRHLIDNYISIILTNFGAIRFYNYLWSLINLTTDHFWMKNAWYDVTKTSFSLKFSDEISLNFLRTCQIDVW